MKIWTDSAKAMLEQSLAHARDLAGHSGADGAEVADDMRRHIDEEVARRKLDVVTAEDIEGILRQLGLSPKSTPNKPNSSHDNNGNAPTSPPPAKLRPFLLFFGVILPVISIAVEVLTHMSAAIYYDPIPDRWHLAMLAAVPAVQLLLWLALRSPIKSWHAWLGAFSGFSMSITIYYALLYGPLTPFACVGLIIYGLGLLPLTPLLALIAAIRSHLLFADRHARIGRTIPGLKWGMAAGVVAVAFSALPIVLTREWSQNYVAGSPTEQSAALRKLRLFGREEILLQDCYSGGSRDGGPLALHLQGKPVSPTEARGIYYRVTGDAFNAKPPPQLDFGAARWNFLDELTWDDDAGGTAVGGRLKGLSLSQSRMDGLINADSATSYVEWIMEFKNVSPVDREARAEIHLPPGGVVSRLTLWVNGEEREAAFAGCGEVRAAYQQIVRVQRRDPVLVTSSGPDRVLMQCFPAPRNGGTIKVRLGITAPVNLVDSSTGQMAWPRMLERNFRIPEHFAHETWIESSQPLRSAHPAFKGEQSKPEIYGLRARLADNAVESNTTAVRVNLDPKSNAAWVADPNGTNGEFVRQTITSVPGKAPARIVFVLDGSKSMRVAQNELVEALKEIPTGTESAVLFAADTVEEWVSLRKTDANFVQLLSQKLSKADFIGGRDGFPALIHAWDLAAQKPGSVVVWIHGPQPQPVDQTEQIHQRLLWRHGLEAPVIHTLQVASGPDRLAEKFHGKTQMLSVPRLGTLPEDLRGLFSRWNPAKNHPTTIRRRHDNREMGELIRGKAGSRHLARLWAKEEVERLINSNKRDEAVRLAGTYQLVTPVSGAVVLETKQQFNQAGLQPVSPETVPTVPEPDAYLLLILGIGLLLLVRSKSRKAASTLPIH